MTSRIIWNILSTAFSTWLFVWRLRRNAFLHVCFIYLLKFNHTDSFSILSKFSMFLHLELGACQGKLFQNAQVNKTKNGARSSFYTWKYGQNHYKCRGLLLSSKGFKGLFGKARIGPIFIVIYRLDPVQKFIKYKRYVFDKFQSLYCYVRPGKQS